MLSQSTPPPSQTVPSTTLTPGGVSTKQPVVVPTTSPPLMPEQKALMQRNNDGIMLDVRIFIVIVLTKKMPANLYLGAVTDMEHFKADLTSVHFLLPCHLLFLEALLKSYFNIVRKNILDTIPKALMHFLVNRTKDAIQNELVQALYREERFIELLAVENKILFSDISRSPLKWHSVECNASLI